MSSKDFIGPPTWTILHSYAAAYNSETQRESFPVFVKTLGKLFPCEICQENFKKKLKILPLEPYLGSNDSLFFWTYCIHDMVNEAIRDSDPSNPKRRSPDYDRVKSFYFQKMNEKCKDCIVK